MRLNRLPLEKRVDPRGTLVQNDHPEIFGNIKHFLISTSAPGIVRGNHYHHNKEEWFYILQGECELHLLDLETQERDVVQISAEKPELIQMLPNVVHAMKNKGQNEMIMLGLINEAFDPADPDTFEYKIL